MLYCTQSKVKELTCDETDTTESAASPWLSAAFTTARLTNTRTVPSTAMDTDQSIAHDSVSGGDEAGEDEFAANERAVLERPNESAPWLAYVAALVQRGRLSAARSLIERALNTIHFRYPYRLYTNCKISNVFAKPVQVLVLI